MPGGLRDTVSSQQGSIIVYLFVCASVCLVRHQVNVSLRACADGPSDHQHLVDEHKTCQQPLRKHGDSSCVFCRPPQRSGPGWVDKGGVDWTSEHQQQGTAKGVWIVMEISEGNMLAAHKIAAFHIVQSCMIGCSRPTIQKPDFTHAVIHEKR